MKPIEFPEQTVVFAENQPPFEPLPAYRSPDGQVISCWRPTFWERIRLLFIGKLWVSAMTFNRPPQGLCLQVKYPFLTGEQDK